jgi:hypothetical protein
MDEKIVTNLLNLMQVWQALPPTMTKTSLKKVDMLCVTKFHLPCCYYMQMSLQCLHLSFQNV